MKIKASNRVFGRVVFPLGFSCKFSSSMALVATAWCIRHNCIVGWEQVKPEARALRVRLSTFVDHLLKTLFSAFQLRSILD